MDEPMRLEAFEKMLAAVLREREENKVKMAILKARGAERTVTYKQLLAAKLELLSLMDRYRMHGLLDKDTKEEP